MKTKCRAFTLVEILVGAAVSSVIAVAIFALMNAGMILSAKNLALNLTSNSMRSSLDRVEQVVQMGDSMPALIDTAGTTVAAGSAAGIKFDRFLGSPFVVTTTAGSIASTATTLTLTRSVHAVASPPAPQAGDIVRIATTADTLRPQIQSVVAGTPDAQSRQSFTVTLTAPLGTTVTVLSGSILTAKTIRSAAFVVMPSNGRQELRHYDNFATANLNNPAKYVLVTDQMGVQTADTTPFSIVTNEGKPFVNFSLRVRSDKGAGIRAMQRDEFNSFSRTETLIRPKTIP